MPLPEIDARHDIAIQIIRATERLAEILDQQKRLRARRIVCRGMQVGQADEALLLRFVVGMLQNRGQELQRIAVRARRTACLFVDEIELRPRPSLLGSGLDRFTREAPSTPA